MSGEVPRRWLLRLGSPRLAVALMGVLAAVGVAILKAGLAPGLPVTVVCSALVVNLLASMATHPRFRAATALTAFHLFLVSVAALVAIGQLSRMRGRVEVTEGEVFRRELAVVEAGPLHWDRLDRVNFRNEGFTIDYAPGLKRGATTNRVSWSEGGHTWRAEVGDQIPLVTQGYRFYTSFNKGYAVLLEWRETDQDVARLGVLHLPGFPLHSDAQSGTVAIEGLGNVAVTLVLEDEVLTPDAAGTFRLPERHRVKLAIGERGAELREGEGIDLDGGRLRYAELRTWMGYTIYADWTLPWLLAAATGAVLSLLVHYLGTFRERDEEAGDDGP